MPEFRYAQLCPVARAAELLGERWTLPVIRELLVGPQRFSDLRRRLPGVSSSVLTQRLQRLEMRDIISRRELPPPAASTVFELTPLGEGLREAVLALARWGMALMEHSRPDDHYEPSWISLAFEVLASPEASRGRRYEIRLPDGDAETVVCIAGGPDGTQLVRDAPGLAGPADTTISGDSTTLLALITRQLDPAAAIEDGRVKAEGGAATLEDFASLFQPLTFQP
jgi:DNA-binding HxlR family transcriptional regulator